jgi:release factor glutamine methyltransferase
VTEVTFSGLSLTTRPGRVMVPRPASEQLVAAALARLGSGPAVAVDVGTGTGAIAVAMAAAAPAVHVFATDSSREAVALARENVRRHGLCDRVTVCHGDLLDPVPGPIDLVVANLPYLPSAEAARYPGLAGEPTAAVFSAGDGLEPYRRLLSACGERLSANGAVILQLHRRVLAAPRAGLPALRVRLACSADGLDALPLEAAA